MVISIIAGISYGALYLTRYMEGTWALTSFEGGLNLSEPLEVIDSRGSVLPAHLTSEFAEICSRLRTTTRAIGEDRGEGFVRLRDPTTENTNFLTLYPSKGVIFHGWWIDAKTYEMMDRRAPCFELSEELERFIKAHHLKSTHEN
jgi:hypothetical protein